MVRWHCCAMAASQRTAAAGPRLHDMGTGSGETLGGRARLQQFAAETRSKADHEGTLSPFDVCCAAGTTFWPCTGRGGVMKQYGYVGVSFNAPLYVLCADLARQPFTTRRASVFSGAACAASNRGAEPPSGCGLSHSAIECQPMLAFHFVSGTLVPSACWQQQREGQQNHWVALHLRQGRLACPRPDASPGDGLTKRTAITCASAT